MPSDTRALSCSEATEYYRMKAEGLDGNKGVVCKRAEHALIGPIMVRKGRYIMKDILLSLKEENKRLSQMAETDWLTGLYNRMAVEKRVSEFLKDKQRGLLLVMDVDSFKKINDRYGHIAGDSVLKGVAGILRKMAFPNDRSLYAGNDKSLKVDIEQIRCELSETRQVPGAFCQDYESFVNIYRFMERCLIRSQSSIYSILFTLSDKQGDFPILEESGQLMECLHEIIQYSLRAGDVFTRYSSCQFLIMVCNASDIDTDSIAKRIQDRFHQYISCYEGYRICYIRYPLKAAFSMSKS